MTELTTSDYKEAYRLHATTLRNWFVVYGVGGPALLLGNEKILVKANAEAVTGVVMLCFIAGAACQVLLSLVDKYADWICYVRSSANIAPAKRNCKQRIADWWMTRDFPSVFLDLATIGAFGYATWEMFFIVA